MREVGGIAPEVSENLYARPAPVKEARLGLDRGHGFEEEEGNHEEKEVESQLASMIMREKANIKVPAGSRQHQGVQYEVNPPCR